MCKACLCVVNVRAVLWDTVSCVLVQVTWGYGCGVVGHCVMCPGAQGIWLGCGMLCVFCPGAGVQGVLLWCCGTLCVMCPGAGDLGVWL